MHYSYKKFPELENVDEKTQYKALKYCLGKNKLFNYLYFPSMVLVAYVGGLFLEKIHITFGFYSDSIFYVTVYYVSLFLILTMYHLIINSTYIHYQVKKHIHEFEVDKTIKK